MINKRLNKRLGITARQFNAKITRLSKLNATLPKIKSSNYLLE